MASILKKIYDSIDGLRSYDLFDRPIFIISAPRSGSTLLYELMLKFDNVCGFSVEADHVWRTIFPRERLEDESDLVSLDDYSPKKEREFKRYLYRSLMWDLENRKKIKFTERVGLRKIRYIEKTIANCFHLEFIEKVFPDCYYIWLIRDPRAVLSSMLVGWKGSKRAKVFKFRDPLKNKFNLEYFGYPRPPGWKNVMNNLCELEAFLWAYTQYIIWAINFFKSLSAKKFLIIRYEDIISDAQKVFKEISHKFSLTWTNNLLVSLSDMPISRTSVTKPFKNKWKRFHGHLFDLPHIKQGLLEIMRILGYEW